MFETFVLWLFVVVGLSVCIAYELLCSSTLFTVLSVDVCLCLLGVFCWVWAFGFCFLVFLVFCVFGVFWWVLLVFFCWVDLIVFLVAIRRERPMCVRDMVVFFSASASRYRHLGSQSPCVFGEVWSCSLKVVSWIDLIVFMAAKEVGPARFGIGIGGSFFGFGRSVSSLGESISVCLWRGLVVFVKSRHMSSGSFI